MRPIDITPKAVRSYLKERGLSVAQLFGSESKRLDPIDRHLALRDMYVHFTDFRMTNEGLEYVDQTQKTRLVVSNMKDFELIDTLEHCVVNMKYLGYVKELNLLRQRKRDNRDFER